jgi:hypothetical protein
MWITSSFEEMEVDSCYGLELLDVCGLLKGQITLARDIMLNVMSSRWITIHSVEKGKLTPSDIIQAQAQSIRHYNSHSRLQRRNSDV